MIISFKDVFKMIGIILMMTCASLVCTLFINYNIDLGSIKNLIEPGQMQKLYDAQMMTGKVVVATAGGCLIITTCVMLLFYIKLYIDSHKSELGILKALGYSNFEISKGFYRFGLSVLLGTTVGYFLAHLLMNSYYSVQNQDGIFPNFSPTFNISLFIFIVIIPTILFCLLSVIYSYIKLKQPVLDLIKNKTNYKNKNKDKFEDIPFLDKIRRNTIRQKKSLAFFVGFAVFCYSAMMQMTANMETLTSKLFAYLIFGIGATLSCVIMILAMSTLMQAQKKNIGMMRIFGYKTDECKKNILDCYRPIAYISFIIGTIYQYALLKVMVNVVFKDVETPNFDFNFKALAFTLVSFLILYETLLYFYSRKIKNLPIKEIMLESN